jgi:hypothetical protein
MRLKISKISISEIQKCRIRFRIQKFRFCSNLRIFAPRKISMYGTQK